MNTYYIELIGSYCGLCQAGDINSARKEALYQHGANNLKLVRKAEDDDIKHIHSFGGWIPEDEAKRLALPTVNARFKT